MARFRPSGGGGTSSSSSSSDDEDSGNDGGGSSDPFEGGSTGSEVLSSGGDESRARSTGSSSGSDDATATPSSSTDDNDSGSGGDTADSSDPFDPGSTGSEVLSSGGDESRARSTGSSSGSNDATATPSTTADDDNDGMVQDADDEQTATQDSPEAGPPELESVQTADSGRQSRGLGERIGTAAERGFDRAQRLGETFGRQLARERREDRRDRQRGGERFGDFDYSLGRGDEDVDEVEQSVEEASTLYSQSVSRAVTNRETGYLLPTDLALDAARLGADVGADAIGYEREADQAINAGEEFAESAVTGLAETGNLPGLLKSGAEAAEFGAFAATEGVDDPAETAADVAGSAANIGSAVAKSAKENPAAFAGSLTGAVAGGVGASIGSGRALGKVSRVATDRVRTAGGTEIDLRDVTDADTADAYRGSAPDQPEFPEAADADLYRDDPAEAVKRQADRDTPDEVNQVFNDAGVEEGSVLKKAVDTEPDGGSSGGFRTQEGSYESPGGFVGPSLSPNFLRTGSRTRTSLRPGLPETGRPTGVLVKTDVENTDASDLDEFNDELREMEGDTTARTKPRSEVNTDEIEAVIPSNAEFESVGGGLLQRAGVGSDFYTRVGGRRVPLRTVAPAGRRADIDVESDDVRLARGDTDTSSARGQSIDEYLRADRSVDRPVPTVPTSSGTTSNNLRSGGDLSGVPGFDVTSRGATSTNDRTGSGGDGSGSGGETAPPSFGGPPITSDGGGGGTDSGGPSPGGSDGPSGGDSQPPSGGGGSGGGPSLPALNPPSNNRRREFEPPESDADEGMISQSVLGEVGTETTDFVDPLTGETLQSED